MGGPLNVKPGLFCLIKLQCKCASCRFSGSFPPPEPTGMMWSTEARMVFGNARFMSTSVEQMPHVVPSRSANSVTDILWGRTLERLQGSQNFVSERFLRPLLPTTVRSINPVHLTHCLIFSGGVPPLRCNNCLHRSEQTFRYFLRVDSLPHTSQIRSLAHS